MRAVELRLLDHKHGLDTGDECPCAAKRLEAEHRPHDAFDGPMVLFDDVVEILRLVLKSANLASQVNKPR